MKIKRYINLILASLTKVFTLAGMAVLISAITFTMPAVLATNLNTPGSAPSWNTGGTPNEINWFQVGNSTQSIDFSNSVTANSNDVLSFRIYMHNDTCPGNDSSNHENCPGTIAQNAFVRVNLPPTGGAVIATIGSDESASNVSRTITINLPDGQTISYKPGTTQSTHNRFDFDNPNGPWPMPDNGMTDNQEDSITTSGVTQGDIHGSYNWSRWIVFQAQVSNVQAPAPSPAPTGQVLGVSVLPATGPESAPILALIGMIPTGLILRRLRI